MINNDTAEAQTKTANHIVFAAYGVSALVDLSTTEYGLGKHVTKEANPFFKPFTDRGPVAAGIAKGAAVAGNSFIFMKLHKEHPKATFWTALTITVAQTYIDYKNIQAIRGSK